MPSLAGTQEHPAHGTLHRVGAGSVQGFLARLAWRTVGTVVGTPTDGTAAEVVRARSGEVALVFEKGDVVIGIVRT
jgi:hypothetical protein